MILDVGAGDVKRGDIGVDLHRGRAVDVIGHAEYLPFKSNIFDVVRHHCLLEHLGNPLQALREQWRVLLPDGLLRFVTDNAAYWRFYFKGSGAHMGGYVSRGFNDRHYAIFTPEHVRNLAKEAGFEGVKVFFEDIHEGPLKSIERAVRKSVRLEHLTYPRISIEAVKGPKMDNFNTKTTSQGLGQ